jgi:hypothetical protein
MKNIEKPCARKSHARFDEEGQADTCSLLYLFFLYETLSGILKRQRAKAS